MARRVVCANGHAVDDGVRFCPVCGSGVQTVCSTGHPVDPAAAFCPVCGVPVAGASPGTPPGGVGGGPPAGPASPRGPAAPVAAGRPAPGPPPIYVRRPPRRWPLAVLVVVLLLAAGGGSYALVRSLSSTVRQSASPTTSSHPTTSAPTTTTTTAPPSTTTTFSPALTQAADSVEVILSGSSQAHGQVQTAVDNVCNDPAGSAAQLQAAAAARQNLAAQVPGLALSALPGGAQIQQTLSTALNDSATADQAYAAWAGDEQPGMCSTNDPNYVQATSTDQQSTAEKNQFLTLWNPVATALHLQTWTADQL